MLDDVGEFDDSRIVRRPSRRGADKAIEPRHVRVLVQLAVLLSDHGVDAERNLRGEHDPGVPLELGVGLADADPAAARPRRGPSREQFANFRELSAAAAQVGQRVMELAMPNDPRPWVHLLNTMFADRQALTEPSTRSTARDSAATRTISGRSGLLSHGYSGRHSRWRGSVGMSLDIAVWIPDNDAYAGRNVVPAPPGASTGVGAESLRYQLWGSAAARRLGAALLPQLAEITVENRGNLQVPPSEIDAFEQECVLLTANVEQLSAATGYDTDRVLHYLTNMRRAVEHARSIHGGIIIW
ncbi:hypothetical protein [Actinoplanes aureus]|uniref:hypothetical protein n=1 Tax=Actinoplanes aureus TaxID=2792083 RepID=UPI001E5D2501|nr:hypothetical protein [Actinoplanes aureus]